MTVTDARAPCAQRPRKTRIRPAILASIGRTGRQQILGSSRSRGERAVSERSRQINEGSFQCSEPERDDLALGARKCCLSCVWQPIPGLAENAMSSPQRGNSFFRGNRPVEHRKVQKPPQRCGVVGSFPSLIRRDNACSSNGRLIPNGEPRAAVNAKQLGSPGLT